MAKPKNPAAFPGQTAYGEYNPWMELRDYFAAKALSSIIVPYPKERIQRDLDEYAIYAYRLADAMMKQRKK